jgi:hypothetical protein
MVEFAHRFLGLFVRPLVTLDGERFQFGSTWYSGKDIEGIKLFVPNAIETLFFPAFPANATVLLRDGSRIRIHGREVFRRDRKPRIGFWVGRSDAFDELVRYFQQLCE